MKKLKLKKDVIAKLTLSDEEQINGGAYQFQSFNDATCHDALCHTNGTCTITEPNHTCKPPCATIVASAGGACYPTVFSCFYGC